LSGIPLPLAVAWVHNVIDENHIRRQAATALDMGEDPEEVRRTVAHGNRKVREIVEEVIRDPNLRRFTVTEPVASTTAVMASLVDGSHANERAHFGIALQGGPNRSLENWRETFVESYKQRPAETLDLSPEGMDHAGRVVSDYPTALTESLVDRATRLPEPRTVDPNTTSINRIRRDNVPFITDAMLQDTEELEMATLGYLLENPEEAGLFSQHQEVLGIFKSMAEGGLRTTVDSPAGVFTPFIKAAARGILATGSRSPGELGKGIDTATGVGQEFVPGRGVVDFTQFARTAQEMGVLDGWVDTVVGSVFHGYTNLRVREHLASLKPEDQAQFFKDFMSRYEKKAGVIGSNWHLWTMMQGIANDEFLATMDPQDRLDMWMSNIASIGALVEATGIGIIVGGAMRHGARTFPAAAEMMWRSRPGAGQKNIQHMVQALSNIDFTRRWGTDKIDVIATQLPGPEVVAPLRNLPDGILNEIDIDRVEELVDVAGEIAARQNANVLSTKERTGVVASLVADIEGLHGAHLRPSMSRIQLLDDESGVRFRLMVGKDDAHGFGTMEEAVAYAQRHGDGPDVTFFRVGEDGVSLEPYKPSLKRRNDGTWEAVPGQTGEFFVSLRRDHYFSPLDQALFGDTPVIAGTWMGRAMRWATTPSAHMDQTIYNKWTRAFTREQAMVNALDSITAPLFRNLGFNERLQVNDIMLWAEDFGKQTGRNPDIVELRAQFPEFKDNVFGGYYQARTFYDTVHRLQNDRVYRAWHNQGYKTATNGETSYHGAVVPWDSAKTLVGKEIEVLDAQTGRSITLDAKAAEEAYANGAVLMRQDLPVEAVEGGGLHRHVLVDTGTGWRLGELSRFPLKYVPGYYTRMYRDSHYIRRINTREKIDGREAPHESVMQVATTKQEADVRRALEVDRLGERLYGASWDKSFPRTVKDRMLAEKGYAVEVSDDVRLSAIDREAMDMNQMRMEGRLFFDNRAERPLTDVYGNPAEVVDPINTIQRVGRMVSRQVAIEDLLKQQKKQFFETYGKTIPELATVGGRSSREIGATLNALAASKRGDEGKTVAGAKAWWDYIRVMEGTMTGDASAFRKAMIGAAEWFDLNVGWKMGGNKGRAWTKELSRGAHKADLFGGLKSLAFLHFITARPIRQLFLQGGQHLSIQAIDPLYFGRLQLDALSLMSATKMLGRGREGRKLMTMRDKQMAKGLGYSPEEYGILLREFNMSGLIDTVDVHTYAGGMPKSAAFTPQTTVGKTAQMAGDGITYIPEKMRAYGFDTGEQFNVTTSYLMALRRHKAEKGIKDLRDMTRQDWDDVAARGSGFALAMHRANSAAWQYGWLGVPLQFLQFTHKWLMTMLGASKWARKAGIANQSFTLGEARKIVAGQVLLFGGAGFGITESIKREAQKRNLPLSADQVNLIASGSLDYTLDKALQALADDPDLDLAWADGFAPGQGFTSTLRTFGEAAFGNKHLEFLVGPGGLAASRVWQAAHTSWTIGGGQIENMTDNEKAVAITEAIAAGFLSSASDYLKIKMAHKVGQWTNQSGVGLGPNLEAKYSELVAKGLLGVNAQKVLDYYATQRAITNMQDDIRKDANEAFNHVNRIIGVWGDGKFSNQEAMSHINHAVSALGVYDENERAIFLEEFYFLMKNSRLENKDMFERIADIVNRGGTPDFIQGITNSGMFSPEQQGLLKQMLEDGIADQEAWKEREAFILDQQKDIIRSIPSE
jgi:hypothetical protein